MSLASIQRIKEVSHHPNADTLDIVKVLGYECIVKLGQWHAGDLCVFIEPDSILPDKPWAAFYKAKSSRVRAIKLRGSWSMGIVESPVALLSDQENIFPIDEGMDVTETLGVTKYEPPQPQNLDAQGIYGFNIPKTDEERYQSLKEIPYGEKCDVTLKIDGQSWSAICKLPPPGETIFTAIGGRSFLFKPESVNNYTRNEKQYDVLKKLDAFCRQHQVSLCIRGEQYGQGIQKFPINPHSKKDLGLAFYSTWLIDEQRYARKGDPYYIHTIAKELDLPTVPLLWQDIILTPELIKRYDETVHDLDGVMFEGVVINWSGGSFKIINKHYDSKK